MVVGEFLSALHQGDYESAARYFILFGLSVTVAYYVAARARARQNEEQAAKSIAKKK